MNDNVFAYNQINLDMQRSGFDMSHDVLTTFDTGDLIPLGTPVEVLAGDTWDMKLNAVVRMTTPIFPVMGNAYLDVFGFFVPGRLIYDYWEELHGANKTTAWEPQTEHGFPILEAPSGGWGEGTLADYMGVPTKVGNIEVNALPFRGYTLIWNEWFRDETRKDASMIHKDETTRTGVNTGTYTTDPELGGLPLKVARYHDLFTSTLRRPQRGPSVNLPLAITDIAPVFASNLTNSTGIGHTYVSKNLLDYSKAAQNSMRVSASAERFGPTGVIFGKTAETNLAATPPVTDIWANTAGTNARAAMLKGTGSAFELKQKDATDSATLSTNSFTPINLWADTANLQLGGTINELRERFAIQRYYEAMARAGGGRFTEIIYAMFGVKSPDARLQRPEYIKALRQPINISAVLQTSSTDSVSPQGNVAANSVSIIVDGDLGYYSRTEPGYLYFLACVRVDHSYQQGLTQIWNRRSKFDMYWPQLANIGETRVLNKRIYAQGSNVVDSDGNVVDDQVFGYQEAWAEYRYLENTVHGKFRSNATGSLDSWHYADYYTTLPIGVSDSWIDEPSTNVARTLAVTGQPQFFGDFYFKMKAYRPMPVESIPGLIDHH